MSQSPVQNTMSLRRRVYLTLLVSLKVSRTSPVFDNPDNLRIAGQVFGRSLRCDVSAVFSHDRLGGTGFVEEQCRGTGPLAARPIKSTYFQHDLSLLMVTSIAWPRERLSGVSTAKLLFLPLFYTAFLRKEVTMYSPQLRSEALRPASLRAECLHTLFGILLHWSILPHLFSHWPMSVQTHEYLFHASGEDAILLYFVVPVGPTWGVGCFFSGSSILLTYPHPCRFFYFSYFCFLF